MGKKKSTKTTILLVLIILMLMSASFYISYVMSDEDTEISAIAPKKIKAASKTYTKLIALNQGYQGTGEAAEAESGISISPTESATSTLSTSITPGVSVTLSPSPTEIILAYQNPTEPTSTSSAATQAATRAPTNVESLPESGFIHSALILFSVSSLLIFFSFLF